MSKKQDVCRCVWGRSYMCHAHGELSFLFVSLTLLSFSSPTTSQLAKAMEAFGRFLTLRPELATPIVNACFSAMLLLPVRGEGDMVPVLPGCLAATVP